MALWSMYVNVSWGDGMYYLHNAKKEVQAVQTCLKHNNRKHMPMALRSNVSTPSACFLWQNIQLLSRTVRAPQL